jgi:prepilin peptidase CpaA
MNLISFAPLWLLALLACLLAAAALEDAVRFRISNMFPLAVVVGAFVAAALHGPSLDLWQNGLVLLAILLVGTAAFAAGLLGGGDIKLFAAVGLWLDLRSAITLVALVFVAGGLLALVYLGVRFGRGRGLDRKGRVPYGIAIGIGALALIILDPRISKPHQRPFQPLKVMSYHS